MAVACNKVDLSGRREVSLEQAQQFASSIKASVHETSAKTNEGECHVSQPPVLPCATERSWLAGVEELFMLVAKQLLQQSPESGSQADGGKSVDVSSKSSGSGKSGCC